jgi:hypothetical protein
MRLCRVAQGRRPGGLSYPVHGGAAAAVTVSTAAARPTANANLRMRLLPSRFAGNPERGSRRRRASSGHASLRSKQRGHLCRAAGRLRTFAPTESRPVPLRGPECPLAVHASQGGRIPSATR